MKYVLLLCILMLLHTYAARHGKSSSSSSDDSDDSCTPIKCFGEEGELGSSCGPISDGCGHTLHCGPCKSGKGYENLRCRHGKCVCLVTGCPTGSPCIRPDGCGGNQTCCEPPGASTHDYGCCEVGGQFICAQLIGGVCPEIHHNQDSAADKDFSIMEVVEVESKGHSSLQVSPSKSKWIVGTIGGLLIVAGLAFIVKRRRNYHIESAHLLSSRHPPLY